MQLVCGRGEAYIGFEWGTLKERKHWGDPGVDGRIILRWIFGKWDVGVGTEFGWLRIEKGGERVVNVVINLRVP
jgi:hypothetical protein